MKRFRKRDDTISYILESHFSKMHSLKPNVEKTVN